MSSHYHTNDPRTIAWLIGVLSNALEQGQSMRFDVQDQTLKVKRGEGGWSAPLMGTPDVYRDSLDFATVRAVEAASMTTEQSVSLQRLGSRTAGTSD
jgi:hypothetical protein